jgi:hypothetical protein
MAPLEGGQSLAEAEPIHITNPLFIAAVSIDTETI